jgi:hypothetical protein
MKKHAIASVVVVGLVFSSCTGRSGSPDSGGTTFAPTRSQAAGPDWQVDLPQELKDHEVEVDATPTGPASGWGSVPAGTQRGGNAVEIRITGDSLQGRKATLSRRLSKPVPSDRSMALAYLAEETGFWTPVVTTLSADRQTLTAQVDHFSLWDDLTAKIGNVTGNRGKQPTCTGNVPKWAGEIVSLDDANAPFRSCAGSDPRRPELLVVKVSNNRGYGLGLQAAVSPVWGWSSPGGFSGPENFLTWGIAAGLSLPETVRRALTGGAFLPPGGELNLGFSESEVRSIGSRALLSATTDLTYVIAGVAYKAVVSALENGSEAVAAASSLLAAWQCLHDFGRSTDWESVRTAAYECAVSNFDDVSDLIVDLGSRLPVTEASLGAAAAAAQRALMAIFAFSTGFTLGEYLSDLRLDRAAYDVRVFPRPVPRTLDLTLAPGRLGTLKIGMTGAEAVRTGYIRRASGEICGRMYDNSAALERLVGEQSVYPDFRFRDNPNDLDAILIKGPQPKTADGIRIGTTLSRLRSAYGSRLVNIGPDQFLDPTNTEPDYALFDGQGALIFGIGEEGGEKSISWIWITSGSDPQTIYRPFGEC